MTYELQEKMTEESHVYPTREPISDAIAAKHDKTLAKLRNLLTHRGIRTHIVEYLKLTLKSSTWPAPPESTQHRYSPELLIFAPQGWRVATVRVAPRSGAYLVEVAQVDGRGGLAPDRRYMIPSHEPARVLPLLPGYVTDGS
jgi:hypothetical protein